MTFSVLLFATKCVKERVMLGAETCDISILEKPPNQNRIPGSGSLSQLLSPTVGSFTCRNESTDQDWDQISAGPLGFRSQDLEHFLGSRSHGVTTCSKKFVFGKKIR